MDEVKLILDELSKNNIRISGEITRDITSHNKFFAFIETNRDQDNKQQPSNRKLESIKYYFLSLDIQLDFILLDKSKDDIEAGIRASLMHSFGDVVRNVFLSITNESVDVWIDPKRIATQEENSQIQNKSEMYFDIFDIKFNNIFYTSTGNLPAKLTCLRALRTASPATISEISKKISSMGLTVPSDTWLSHRMDALRKDNLTVRLKNGKHALTHEGLSLLGTRKNARSPDIARLLDLARRGN